MISHLLSIDQQITNFIVSLIPRNNFFNLFFSFFSQQGNSVLIWIIVIGFLILFEERKDKRFILYFAINFVIALILSNYVLKNIFMRARPLAGGVELSYPIDYSLPSGHAATAFAAAATLSFFHKKRKWYFYGIAFLIALSRIYLHCHYLLDIVTGGALGYAISHLVLLIHKRPIIGKK